MPTEIESRIAAGIRRVRNVLIIVAIMLTMHISPTWKATEITAGDQHGITVRPAIVAASKVPAGVTAQVELTMNFPAQHGWGVPIGTKPSASDPSQKDSGSQQIGIADQPSGPSAVPIYQGPRKVRFAGDGEYWADPWAIPLTFQQHADGAYSFTTSEDGVTFSVKSAVAVKPKPQLKWSAEYLYGTNGTHTAIIGKDLFGWLAVKGGMEFGAGQVEGKVGGEVRF